ncbi:hypothetical protein NW762_008797 [Fusarium torreyae]|uniref:Uncharacterized protein n=1 Tax=Fusarium torreyae TaxID=1237075 RepID=A0A9W8RW04_9HYPO|nr:hypothetical protein NW762_008797 [Fusarium torreyae]
MLFLSSFATLFSLAAANTLPYGGEVGDPSYNSNKYHWECGMPAKEWEHKTCKATLQINHLPRGGLKIQTNELIEVAEWGLKSLCGRSSQRVMVNPQNDDWKLWLTEPSWNRSKPFTL